MKHDIVRNPTNGTFELTGRCNLQCKMCLVRVDGKKIDQMGLRERTAKEWIDMARQAADAGTLGLLLTGGEIMLRPDFTEIYEAIAQMGFLLTIYTNATMVTEKVMEVLRKFPPHKIGVTMYGASKETYKKLCGCEDGYDRFTDGIHKLSVLPSVFDIRTTIVKDNLKDLQAMRDFTAQTFGDEKVLHISRGVWDTVRGGIACPKECRLSPEENVSLAYPWLLEIQDKILSGKLPYPEKGEKLHLNHVNKMAEEEYIFSSCEAGVNQYIINWSGRMYACEMADQGYTEPFRYGFIKAWEQLPEQYPLVHVNETCQNCSYAGVCEACPASRMAETGDWFGIPEYSCREAKRVYQILDSLGVLKNI